MSNITIATDGSYKGGRIGYGGVIVDNNNKILHRYWGEVTMFPKSRNITGECRAVIEGLQWAKDNGYTSVTLLFDYKGLENWVTGRWIARSPVSKDYLDKVSPLLESLDVTWEWVNGHSGDFLNDMADTLASWGISP